MSINLKTVFNENKRQVCSRRAPQINKLRLGVCMSV